MADRLTNYPYGVKSAVGFYGPLRGSIKTSAVQALTPVSTANATDLSSAIALANANKAAINAVITALKA